MLQQGLFSTSEEEPQVKDTSESKEMEQVEDIEGTLAEAVNFINEKNQKKPEEKSTQQKEEQSKTETSKQEVENSEETEKLSELEDKTPEDLEKRFTDAQSMIGRQGNELGELRKQNKELQKRLDLLENPVVEKEKPYFEKTTEEISALIKEKYPDFTEEEVMDQARTIKNQVQMVRDILDTELAPFKETLEVQNKRKLFKEKEIEFRKNHPDLDKRLKKMDEFADRLYPEGLPKDVDPFVIAHIAYETVGDISSEDLEKKVQDKKDQQKVVTRSLNQSTSQSEKEVGKPTKKLNPLQQELAKSPMWRHLYEQ